MSISLDGTSGINTPSISAGNIVGEVSFFAMDTPPTGWLKANGAEIDRTAYASLFNVIGTTYGAGDGSTTFNLPDLRGEFLRAWDDSAGVDTGRVFASAQNEEIGPHRHNVPIPVDSVRDFPEGSAGQRGTVYPNSSSFSEPDNPSEPEDKIPLTGEGIGTETRPRNVALLACIKF